MSKTTVIHARIDPALKKAVEGILASKGLTHSEFVNGLYRYTAEKKELPLQMEASAKFLRWLDHLPVSKNVPNKTTVKAMKSSVKGRKRYNNFQEVLDEMGLK